jgi:hypothetical protein
MAGVPRGLDFFVSYTSSEQAVGGADRLGSPNASVSTKAAQPNGSWVLAAGGTYGAAHDDLGGRSWLSRSPNADRPAEEDLLERGELIEQLAHGPYPGCVNEAVTRAM